RATAKTPPEAFASACAEPQLASAHDSDELLKLAGFGSVRQIPTTETVLAAARLASAEPSQKLAPAASARAGAGAGAGALFLQELAWEAQSWRARMRALEGGALEINLWIADKQALMDETQEAASDEVLDAAVQPDDAGAAEALFEKDGDKPAQ